MNAAYRLGLLGMILGEVGKDVLSEEKTPELVNYLEKHGVSQLTEEHIMGQIVNTLNVIGREFDYYDASELKVNTVLDRYLKETLDSIENGIYQFPRDISMLICSLGNKGGAFTETEGVGELISTGKGLVNYLLEQDEGSLRNTPAEVYSATARKLEYIDKILSLVDIFVTSRQGLLAGLEEYAPMDYTYLHPIEVNHWGVPGLECAGGESCECGCVLDHPLHVLQGLEDYLDGIQSTDRDYFMTVAEMNGVKLRSIEGSEGQVFDSIKAVARNAYQAALSGWEQLKAWYESSEKEKADNDAVAKTGEDNKKAVQTMPTKNVTINDKAREGIKTLAEKVDVSGAMSQVVNRLRTPTDVGGVIDGLLGLLKKEEVNGEKLRADKKAVDTTLAELRKASQQTSGNDEDKEAVSAAKAAVQETVKAAKEAVAEAKKKIGEHDKLVKGLRKAIKGITPHIFIKEGGNTEGTNT